MAKAQRKVTSKVPVFVSWSGEYAKEVAVALKSFLENTIQACDPFVSDQDIEAGDRWAEEIRRTLDDSKAGIICLTRDRLESRWINYEAGAMATTKRVIPYCIDLDPTQLGLPLGQNQAVRADRTGTARLIRSLNELLGEGQRTEKQLDVSMDAWWNGLETNLSKAKVAEEARRGRPVTEPNPTVDDRLRTIEDLIRSLGAQEEAKRGDENIIVRYLTKRRRLTDRRAGYTQQAMIHGTEVIFRTGEYYDGSLGEIFIDLKKQGEALRSVISAFASVVSLALQHGVPLEELVDEFLFTRFEPNGVVEGSRYVKMTTSVLDYIFRELAITYLARYDLAHVLPEELGGDKVADDETEGGDEIAPEPPLDPEPPRDG